MACKTIYLIGSLRNPRVPEVAKALRKNGFDVFDDWYSPGPTTDDDWLAYEQARGRSFTEALRGYHARHVFEFDIAHLNRADTGVLILPAGKCGHLELGYLVGQGKPGYILLDQEPDRFDIMYGLATRVCHTLQEIVEALHESLYQRPVKQ